jgi:hypothetical protein
VAVGAPELTLLKLGKQLIASPDQSGNPANVGSALNVIELQDAYICDAAIDAGMTLQILPHQEALFNPLLRARREGVNLAKVHRLGG